jgi:hypothetical protein
MDLYNEGVGNPLAERERTSCNVCGVWGREVVNTVEAVFVAVSGDRRLVGAMYDAMNAQGKEREGHDSVLWGGQEHMDGGERRSLEDWTAGIWGLPTSLASGLVEA